MYKKTKAIHLLQILSLLAVMGFCSVSQAQVNVKLEVSGDKLVATTRGTCTKQPNPPGCARISGRKNINFSLPANFQCSSGNWDLDHVALSNSEGAQPGGLSEVAASDFNADRASGKVTPENQSARHILIRDHNSKPYDIWYTVYATCGGKTIDSDPRLENDGTGY